MPYRLQFAGDTSILTTYVPLSATPETVELVAVATIDAQRAMLGTLATSELRLFRNVGGLLTLRLFGTNNAFTTLNMALQAEHRVASFWTPGGGNSRGELDALTESATSGGGGAAALTIGIADVIPGWLGTIADVKIYSGDFGTLINHWPIDDNVPDGGTILDVVGGKDGVLTLGSGSWVWVPTEFGITRPIMRDIVRTITRLGVAGPGV